MLRALFLGALLSAMGSAWAESEAKARLWLGAGFDSNAKRDFVAPGQTGVLPEPDGVFSALGTVEGSARGERLAGFGSYDAGVRKFLRLPSEDVFIHSLELEGLWAASSKVGLGLSAHGKDRRGGDRDYTNLSADLLVDFTPDESVEVRLRGGPHRFLYWNRIDYSFYAPFGAFSGRYRFNRRHSVVAGAEVERRTYNSLAHDDPNAPEPPPARVRSDFVLSAHAGYTYRGPFTLSVTYAYSEQTSNSFGETVLRHRLSVSAGTRLPWGMLLLAQGGVQLSSYPEGVYLSPELNVLEDDERHNSLSLKLVKPLSERTDVELRYALYQNQLPRNSFDYLRHAAWLGVSWRL